MRQFDYDQSAVIVTREMGYPGLLNVVEQFLGEGKEQILSKYESMFWPNKARMGIRSSGSSIYWKNLGKMCELS